MNNMLEDNIESLEYFNTMVLLSEKELKECKYVLKELKYFLTNYDFGSLNTGKITFDQEMKSLNFKILSHLMILFVGSALSGFILTPFLLVLSTFMLIKKDDLLKIIKDKNKYNRMSKRLKECIFEYDCDLKTLGQLESKIEYRMDQVFSHKESLKKKAKEYEDLINNINNEYISSFLESKEIDCQIDIDSSIKRLEIKKTN